MDDEVWKDDLYKNWIRGAKGLEFLQEGLREFVEDKAPECRNQQLQNKTQCPTGSLPQCNQCTSHNLLPQHARPKIACTSKTCIQKHSASCYGSDKRERRKCPNGICSQLYDNIVIEHRYRDPFWKNTDPTTWCSDQHGWGYAKCFQTTISPGKSAKDTDAPGLLSFIINNLSMQKWLACQNMDSNTACNFYKAKEIRNEILHSSKQELEEHTLNSYLDTFIAVLKDTKCLVTYKGSQDAIDKLEKLKNKQISVTQTDQTKFLQLHAQAMSELTEQKTVALQEIDERAKATMSEIEGGRIQTFGEIEDRKKATLSEVESGKRNALDEIANRKGAALSEVEIINRKALVEIADSTKASCSEVEGVRKETLKTFDEIQNKQKATLLEVDKNREMALVEIDSRSVNVKDEVTIYQREALGELQDAKHAILSEVEKRKKDAFGEIEDKKSNVISEIEEYRLLDGKSDQQQKMIGGQGKMNVLRSQDNSSAIIYDRISNNPDSKRREERLTQLKEDLVGLYRERHKTLPLSPLIDAEKAPLLEFYVTPDINAVKVQRTYGGGNEIRYPVKSLRDVFFEDSSQFKEIYLSADAGLGKTAFSQRLALTWCQVLDPKKADSEYFRDDEIDVVNEFEFLFLLFLRDSFGKCELPDLIKNQIDQNLPLHGSALTEIDIDMVLSEHNCLVVLDGLDEWTHPETCRRKTIKNGEPHAKVYKTCTVLTTSRPWKLNDISSSSSRFELVRLNEKTKCMLQKNVISHLSGEKDEDKLSDLVNKFSIAVVQHGIADIDSIPLLLMYLLCLWWDNKVLGKSLCELYSNIVELLLSRTIKKYTNLKLDLPKVAKCVARVISHCFRKQTCCTQYCTLLTSLAKLAFQTLFGETRESCLVFDKKIAEKVLNKELLEFCLQAGIISQSKIRGKLTKQEAKISFAHKTVQEFFAALYMQTTTARTTVQRKVLCQCKSVKDILEMSKFFIFLSGINVTVLSSISSHLLNITNKDETTLDYRRMTHVFRYDMYIQPLRELQDMYMSFVKENPRNRDLKFYKDIIIDKECAQETYCKQLQHVVVKIKKENAMSVRVNMEGISCSIQEIIDNFQLTSLRNVVKIYFKGKYDNCDMTPLLHKSVKCLTLISSKWQLHEFIRERSTLPSSLSSRLCSLVNLEGINIDSFEMSHDQLEKLVKYVSERNSLRDIVLLYLVCTDHMDACTGFSLDLSQHARVKKLELLVLPLSELNINVDSLEMCYVGHLSKPGLVSRFLSSLLAARKLHTFRCGKLEASQDTESMLTTLAELVQVKEILFEEINFHNSNVPLTTKMVNIEDIHLLKVTMTALVFRNLLDLVKELEQTVRVNLASSSITPDEEYKAEKEKIKKSQDFCVTLDSSQFNQYRFQFTTIKKRHRDKVQKRHGHFVI